MSWWANVASQAEEGQDRLLFLWSLRIKRHLHSELQQDSGPQPRPDALGYWTAFAPEFYGIEGKSAHHHTHTIIQILYIHVHGNDIKTDMTSVLAAFAQNLTKECLPLPQVFSLHKKARVRLALDSEWLRMLCFLLLSALRSLRYQRQRWEGRIRMH